MALIGYDDTDLAACIRPSLTTIHQPREELSLVTCETAAGAHPHAQGGGWFERDARRTLLTPKLVVRETTGAS